jgi:hypothetical protein
MVFDGAAERELQRNGFADVELSLISRNRDLEHDLGIDRTRRLGAGAHYGSSNEQEERKMTHAYFRRTIKHQKLVPKLER